MRNIAGVKALSLCFGYSRQGYYKRLRVERRRREEEDRLREAVLQKRCRQPRLGTRKLYRLIRPVGYGRDRFFHWMRKEGLLVRRRRCGHRTTYAGRVRYPNALKEARARERALVADITYIRTREGFLYLFLVTHYASRKILGYHLSAQMGAEGSVCALKQALEQVPDAEGMIHHSDRGYQYSSRAMMELTRSHGMQLSMTEEDHVYENAVAERVNGILKDEFMLGGTLASRAAARAQVREAIEIYNNERPHGSLGDATPAAEFEKKCQLF